MGANVPGHKSGIQLRSDRLVTEERGEKVTLVSPTNSDPSFEKVGDSMIIFLRLSIVKKSSDITCRKYLATPDSYFTLLTVVPTSIKH